MSQGFYARLGVQPDAPRDAIEAGFRRAMAEVARRLARARASGGDAAALEARAAELREAWAVLGDEERRRSYDLFRALVDQELPSDPVDLWNRIWPARIEPAAIAALEILHLLTDLPVGRLPGPASAASPAPPAATPSADRRAPGAVPLSLLTDEERDARARAAVEPLPEPGVPAASGAARELAPDDLGQLQATYGHAGRMLQAVREALGISRDQVAATTRIATRYIVAIEEDAYDRLPAAVFVKGYVRELARLYRLDEDAVVARYMERFGERGRR